MQVTFLRGIKTKICLNAVNCRLFHVSSVLCVDKSFGGKSSKDKPKKAEVVKEVVKKILSDEEKKKLDDSRKERELAKKEIRAKQIEIQKKREQLKTSKQKPKKAIDDGED